MHRRRMMSVRLRSCCCTFVYSQDLQAKKKPPMLSCVTAFCVSVKPSFASSRRTPIGSAFCWDGFGSEFLKDLYRRDRSRPSLRSLSWVGLGLSLSLKV